MIRKEDCLSIGKFIKTHGLNGELVLFVENDFPEKYSEEPIFVDIDGGLVPFFIEDDGIFTRNHTSYRIKMEDVDSEHAALRFINCQVYLPKELFSEQEMEGVAGIEGYTVNVVGRGEIGVIDSLADYSGNIVITVVVEEKEVMIPLAEDYITAVDYEAQIITLDLPEGLIDLYLD